MLLLSLVFFSIAWIAVIYFGNCLIAKKLISLNIHGLLLYVLTMAALGLFGEVALDSVYNYIFGKPLWEYHLFPIRHGYTSVYSLFLWGAVGAHLYLLHGTLASRQIKSVHILSFMFCLEAIALEALVNLSYLALFGSYIYYYLPADLWHVTSIQTLPLYLLAGYITVFAIGYAYRIPKWAYAGNSIVLCLLLILR